MILLDNNYCSKYWFTEEIKDCSVNNLNCELDFELIIDDEKLKDNYNNIINNNKSNDTSNYTDSIITSRDRKNKDKSNSSRNEINRNENNNYRNINTKKTNKYFNLQGTIDTNYNKKNMSKLSSLCRISDDKGRNILLDSCPKPILKNLL
jgi:hypothetical protein